MLGKPIVQNSMFGTRLFINDDLHELNEFKNKYDLCSFLKTNFNKTHCKCLHIIFNDHFRSLLLKNRDDSSSQFPTHLSSQTVYVDRHDFLLNHQKKCLDELVEIKEVYNFYYAMSIF